MDQTPGTGVVPLVARGAVPARPPWRRQVEQGTTLAIGLGAELVGGSAAREGTLGTLTDAALGAAVEGQRVLLDATELAVGTGAAIARAGMRIRPLRSIVHGARRALEPVRVHGETTRVVAVREAQSTLPEYTGRATRAALDLIELDDIMDQVDVEKIIERVDIQAIIDRVDIQGIIDRVDIDALLARVDIQQLLDRVDLNEVVTRLDLDALVKSTDLGAIIAQSTGGIASGTVDLVRRQGVGLDGFVGRWAVRIRPRRLRDAPAGPPLLVGNGDDPPRPS